MASLLPFHWPRKFVPQAAPAQPGASAPVSHVNMLRNDAQKTHDTASVDRDGSLDLCPDAVCPDPLPDPSSPLAPSPLSSTLTTQSEVSSAESAPGSRHSSRPSPSPRPSTPSPNALLSKSADSCLQPSQVMPLTHFLVGILFPPLPPSHNSTIAAQHAHLLVRSCSIQGGSKDSFSLPLPPSHPPSLLASLLSPSLSFPSAALHFSFPSPSLDPSA